MLDVLRICGTDVPDHGWHLERTTLAEARDQALAVMPELPTACRGCRAVSACGGSYLPHRWDGASFDNPSVYCGALLTLYDKMVCELVAQLPGRCWTRAGSS
jgi:uncharacterized protein